MKRTSLALLLVVVGCGGGEDPHATDAGDDDPTVDAAIDTDGAISADAEPGPDAGPVDYPYSDLDVGCAPIFRQSIVPEYHLTIAPGDWATMHDELMHPQFDAAGQIIDPPYHPVQVHVVEGDAEHDPEDVMIRLNGNTSWLQAIMFDADPKMQFSMSFNENNPDGRFQGQRKIKLDMPRNDWTMLQQRVALAWLRGRAGIPAQCANSARVYVNGAYYGLFTNAERQDKGFLKRVYGGDDNDGDLWKGGRIITTNEDTFSWDRITVLWHPPDYATIENMTELDTSMIEWASEAVIGDADGYNNGRANFYLYDRPSTGKFVWLVNDLDTVLDADFLPPDATPVFWPMPSYMPRWERDWFHYLTTMDQPGNIDRYVAALATQLPKLDPVEIQQWIVDWSAQIEDAAATDPHRPFPMTDHTGAVTRMQQYAPARAQYLQSWLSCRSSGGADVDGDGYDMCHDCDDRDAAQSPGAVEVCGDAIDNNCDGRVDNATPACSTSAPSPRASAWQQALFTVKPATR